MIETRMGVRILARCLIVFCALLAGVLSPMPASTAPATPQAVPGVDQNFYKLAVSQTGLVKVTYESLQAAGLPVTTLDPATFQLYEQGVEIGRQIVDTDSSGTFTPGDYLLFYGRAVDTYYTGTNIYWLTYGVAPGLDMATRDGTPQVGLPAVTTFLETLHFEQNTLFESALPIGGQADHWYWQIYEPYCPRGKPCTPATFTFQADVPGLASGVYTATLTPRLRGYTYRDHQANFYVNSNYIGNGAFNNQDEFLGSFSFSQGWLIEGSNAISFTVPLGVQPPPAAGQDKGAVNWFELRYQRNYAAPAGGQFPFAVGATSPVSVTLTGVADPETAIYDITDPQHPVRLTGVQIAPGGSFTVNFAHQLNSAAEYIAAGPGQLLEPDSITSDAPSNLRQPAEGADWIIITHADFMSAAQTLADHRRTWQGLRTAVVDVQDVYDEFSGGLMDQEAIRSFVRYAYENWPRPAPRYLVLLGDGHYDPRDYLGIHFPLYIPSYLAPTDPFEGITASDNRYVAYDPVPPANNPPPFMSLGRLPANSLADAEAMISKIIGYETSPIASGWNSKAVFVADDPDLAGNFPASSDVIANSTYTLPVTYSRQKIYYKTDPAYSTVGATTNAIIAAINSGALLVNYHGHASRQNWAGERLLDVTHLSQLNNAGMYPVMLPMTCLEGYFIAPGATRQSFGESIVRLPNAGAVASWSPTGKGVATGHEDMWTALYEAIFLQGITEIGPATDRAKLALYNSDSLFKDLIDTYILFGDPAMALRVLVPDVWVQKLSTPDVVPWQPGQAITYTLTYGNAGDALAPGVILTDTLPPQVVSPSWSASDPAVIALPGQTYVWQLPDLAPGAGGVITVTGTVDPALSGPVTLINIATISTTGPERQADKANNTSQVSDPAGSGTVLLGGYAFEDLDLSGTRDPLTEPGIAGVMITVRNGAGAVVTTALTNAQGYWQVELPADQYTASAPFDAGLYILYTFSPLVRDLSAGGAALDVDFGYIRPTGLELESFTAVRVGNDVHLAWSTRSELDLRGFNVFRSTDPLSYGKQINVGEIPAAAPPGGGAQYSLLDPDQGTGGPLYYWLGAILYSDPGHPFWFGPVSPGRGGVAYLPLIRR